MMLYDMNTQGATAAETETTTDDNFSSDDQESVACPGDVWIVWGLLHVVGGELIGSFILVPRNNNLCI